MGIPATGVCDATLYSHAVTTIAYAWSRALGAAPPKQSFLHRARRENETIERSVAKVHSCGAPQFKLSNISGGVTVSFVQIGFRFS